MINKYLANQLTIDRLYNAYLINVDDISLALTEVKLFLKNKFLRDIEPEFSVDYHQINRKSGKIKEITVDQIREMQSFMHKTSLSTGYKFVVIYEADKMNLNAVNSCLKILEEAAKNSYLFLITNNASAIINTIKSRCTLLNHYYHSSSSSSLQEDQTQVTEFTSFLLRERNTVEDLRKYVEFLKKISQQEQDLWLNFVNFIEILFAKLLKKSLAISEISLNKEEQLIWQELKQKTPFFIQQKYAQLEKIISQTKLYDLDIRSSTILLIERIQA